MAKKRGIFRLCLICGVVLTLGGVLVSVGVPVEASEEAVLLGSAAPAEAGWLLSSEASSGSGYLWADGAGELRDSAATDSALPGYSWASGTAGLEN